MSTIELQYKTFFKLKYEKTIIKYVFQKLKTEKTTKLYSKSLYD